MALLRRFALSFPHRVLSRGLSSGLPPVAAFTKLSDGTAEDFRRTQAYFAKEASPEAITEKYLGMVAALKGIYHVTKRWF